MIRQLQKNFRDDLQRNVSHILEEWYLCYHSSTDGQQSCEDHKLFAKSMELLHHVYVYCSYAGFRGADTLIKGMILRIEQLQFVQVSKKNEIRDIFDECLRELVRWAESIRENPQATPPGEQKLLDRLDTELARLRADSSVYNLSSSLTGSQKRSGISGKKRKNLLIVESSTQISDLARSCLKDQYSITRRSTRSEALRELEQNSCDLLITDMVSSTPQSIEFIKTLGSRGIPVIVISGFPEGVLLKAKKLLDVTILYRPLSLKSVQIAIGTIFKECRPVQSSS